MKQVDSKDFQIPKAKGIPYGGGQERDLSKYFKESSKAHGMGKCRYMWVRLRNYVCFLLAYIAPSNKLRVTLNRWKGVHVADGAYIGMFVFIDNAYPESVFIEEDVAINAGCMLVAHFNPMAHFRRTVLAKVDPIVLKRGSMLGMRSIIMPGVTVGEYSMVSVASVVYKDVEKQTIVRGNPAEEIGKVRL
ncbi:MAG: acyltransferase [Paludibacteraceae bacterium]|nr:acyltransferase [Paludibacteraceae bacterium]HOU68081.1 acyltransferase [Paludibacteraceae bacterium]HQF49917.1 acyltransferase [Paludibacteraceae bacterium]HQJ89089.1 acyltransferase [Paludibacteraceae bacterium]